MINLTLYERILKAILDYADDPDMDIRLSKAQFETIAEIAATEMNDILREATDAIITQLQDAIDRIKGARSP